MKSCKIESGAPRPIPVKLSRGFDRRDRSLSDLKVLGDCSTRYADGADDPAFRIMEGNAAREDDKATIGVLQPGRRAAGFAKFADHFGIEPEQCRGLGLTKRDIG